MTGNMTGNMSFWKKLSIKYRILVLIAPVILIFDQWTKILITSNFSYGESLPIIPGFFSLTYIRNKGAAFGFLSTAHPEFRVPFFFIVPSLALITVMYLIHKLPSTNRLLSTAFSLVMGGAVGNLLDRLNYGYVVDFLDFNFGTYHYPSFNVADSAICVGVALMVWDMFTNSEKG